jgi:glutamine cyclotransferase
MRILRNYIVSVSAISVLLAFICGCSTALEEIIPKKYSYSVVKEFPHDSSAFTQGLVWEGGTVFESTGLYGQSSLRRVHLETGQVEQQVNLDKQIFGEGITVFQDKIVQLSWKNKIVFVRNEETFKLINSFPYPRLGWGITHDAQCH